MTPVPGTSTTTSEVKRNSILNIFSSKIDVLAAQRNRDSCGAGQTGGDATNPPDQVGDRSGVETPIEGNQFHRSSSLPDQPTAQPAAKGDKKQINGQGDHPDDGPGDARRP